MKELGPEARRQFMKMGRLWEQGQHVLITGGTGSGKSTVGRKVLDQRLARKGAVIVFVGKLSPDPTILRDYKDFTRWTHFKKSASAFENKVLLWPNTNRYRLMGDKKKLQREVFFDALNRLANVGKWCVDIDEGLYTVNPRQLNLGDPLATMSNMGRSSFLSLIVLAQRPSHLPLELYSNASHVFTARTALPQDKKRLAELNTQEEFSEVMAKLKKLNRYDFLWSPVVTDEKSEVVNLNR